MDNRIVAPTAIPSALNSAQQAPRCLPANSFIINSQMCFVCFAGWIASAEAGRRPVSGEHLSPAATKLGDGN
jgi:hypothetical protein